jgi:hypothetical protein
LRKLLEAARDFATVGSPRSSKKTWFSKSGDLAFFKKDNEEDEDELIDSDDKSPTS